MQLNQNDLEELCEMAINAARKAGSLIADYSTRNVSVKKKTGGDSLASQVVTEVDLKSQEIILQILKPTFEKYDLALLTEELIDDRSRLTKDYFWCIDPLDGTLPFTLQNTGYAVSIALVAKNGTPQIGVVFDPVKQTLYHAIIACGAFCNKKPWKWNELSNKKQGFTLYHDRSFLDDKKYQYVLAKMNDISIDLGSKGMRIINHGGAVMNACWVLESAPACYFKFPKKQTGGGSFWDFAASSCIYKEAGGWVSDIFGKELELNNKYSTFMNNKGILYASNTQLAKQIINLNNKMNES